MDTDEPDLRSLFNAQTGRTDWNELQRHFARGVLVLVTTELDLVEVAARIAEDDKTQIAAWMNTGEVRGPEVDDAKRYAEHNTEFWAVVSAPWVLAQEVTAENAGKDSRH